MSRGEMQIIFIALLPHAAGAILATYFRRSHPVACLLAALGCGVGAVALSVPLLTDYVSPERPLIGEWSDPALMLMSHIAGQALLVAAVFVGRSSPQAPPDPPSDAGTLAPRAADSTGVRPADTLATAPRRES